ncbi:MAG TPA: arylamine N-acetyltransferase [Pirellulales bacterium]|nr:arylamine N-acetyltransferase [Pirellulales bacterium]
MNVDAPAEIDLDAYLDRIAYRGGLEPTLETLEEIHFAHARHIPFENLDVLLGRPIRLDLASLQAKLVQGCRGGYCFEQNELLAAVLERLGFTVTRLAGRVRMGAGASIRPRSHMMLQVHLDGHSWLADVGFGSAGLLKPVRLIPDEISPQFAWAYRLVREGELWVLQFLLAGQWTDLYAFTLEPQYPIDYEVASYFTSTHPRSIFLKMLLVQRPGAEVRYVLRDRELSITRGDETASQPIETDDKLLAVLAETFGLQFPPGTRFLP